MDSFISWVGGKRLLRKKIISLFPAEGVERYIEVFGGAGWILFGKDKHAGFEIYNDINSDLVNLFRVVKFHSGELRRELYLTLNARENFNDFRSQMKAQGLTDIQRAARFFILIKTSYGSDRHSFGCIRKNMAKITEYIEKVSERLNTVMVENKSYDALIKLYDKPAALFYLDPPYHGTEKYYDNKFTDADHKKLCEILKQIQGRFILSYNDDDFIRDLYKNFTIIEASRSSNLMQRYAEGQKKFKELIIKNF
jgi:DNA adenine methylase